MPANSNEYPWPPYLNNYTFFDTRVESHSKVRRIIPLDDEGVYDIYRYNLDPCKLKTFVCDCYSFGYAEFIEVKQKLNDLNAIVINSVWCSYTDEAKVICSEQEIGLFTFSEFMGALNYSDFWSYIPPEK